MLNQIFKICPTLGEYHALATPYVVSVEEYSEYYKQHKEAIDRESRIYGTISNDRRRMGGDDKIHKI